MKTLPLSPAMLPVLDWQAFGTPATELAELATDANAEEPAGFAAIPPGMLRASFLGLLEVVVVAVLGVVVVSSPSDLSSFCDSPAEDGTFELST